MNMSIGYSRSLIMNHFSGPGKAIGPVRVCASVS